MFQDVCNKFENSLAVLLISDEGKQKEKLENLKVKWTDISLRLQEAEVSIPENVSAGERLDLIEARLKQMETAINSSQDMSTETELDLYIGKLQVIAKLTIL